MSAYVFDSRTIGQADTYGQRFMREGKYPYGVVIAPCGDMDSSYPFTVEVVDNSDNSKMQQQSVELVYGDRSFRPDTDEVKIKVGDLVTWTCRQPNAPPFEVISATDFFSSARLVNESGYAHAFGSPGDYEWMDAYGSGLRGVVRVHQPEVHDKDALASWRSQLSKGALVTIAESEAEPSQLDIVVGQTVYFAVTKCPGVSITDVRIVGSGPQTQSHEDDSSDPLSSAE